MNKWVFEIQRKLADELDWYKGRDNSYVDDNIQEIQELYMEDNQQGKNKGKVEEEEEEVILIKLHEVSESSSTKSSSFIDEEVDNFIKYMKFVNLPTQTRIFWPSPHYQSLQSSSEQDSDFWKEVAMTLVENKYNLETSRNGYLIKIFQGGLLL